MGRTTISSLSNEVAPDCDAATPPTSRRRAGAIDRVAFKHVHGLEMGPNAPTSIALGNPQDPSHGAHGGAFGLISVKVVSKLAVACLGQFHGQFWQ